MKDLYEKESQVLEHAREFMECMDARAPLSYREEYAILASEYEQLLRQLRWVTRISDLTALGLNSDRTTLLNKVNVDALTEIYNRRFLMTNLEHNVAEMRVTQQCLTVMMLDVDFFKSYNDVYGHSEGDNCLRKIATTIHNSLCGANDFVVRYGGEEFIAVLPNADKARGVHIAEKILKNVENLEIPHTQSSVSSYVTISIGLISCIPQENHKMQQYIDYADKALYRSKNNGRNMWTYVEFEEEM